ncbi:hypothetical protein ACG7TL_009004 [Trametes sanguinea]
MSPIVSIDHYPMIRVILAICVAALFSHRELKRLETYSVSTHLLLICVPPFIGTSMLRHTLPLVQAALISFSAFLLTLIISTALYRLSPYHPLAAYRGPLGCKLSKFWMACLSVTGRQHLYLKRLHERYGDAVRIGPNELSFRDPSILGAMLGVGGVPKGPQIAGRVLSITNVPFIGIMDPEVHSERRKPWARAFSATALKEYEPMVARRADQLVQVLEKQEKEVMLGKFFNYFAYDFMCDMAFGGGSELLRDGDQNNQLMDDGILAIVAGSDTTSSALTSLIHCLLSHPGTMKRLQTEIDEYYPAGENVFDTTHYRAMHYLTAVINETLRLYPPVPTGTQRRVPHRSQGVMLGSYFVAPGTAMFLHPYSLQRDPRNFFPFPEEFWPERWLVAAGHSTFADALARSPDANANVETTSFRHNESAFLPFSHGPANCVGKQLAMQEMRMVVCALIQKFELRLREWWDVDKYDEAFLDYFVTTRPDLPVTLRARI